MAGNARRNGKPPARRLRPASKNQLWRLNEQGMLRPEFTEAAFVAGADPENKPISSDEADALLHRLVTGRFRGLERWPKPGEVWRVEGGLVVPVVPAGTGERS